MTDSIKLVRGDDSNFLNETLLIIDFESEGIDLTGFKAFLTIENAFDFTKMYDLENGSSIEIILDKVITSTLEIGTHRCNVKLIDTLNRVRTVKSFNIDIVNEFDVNDLKYSEHTINVKFNYSNYNELFNKPSINNIELTGNKSLLELGIQPAGEYATNDDLNTYIENTNLEIDNLQNKVFNKADISYVEEELETKADKIELNNKANVSDIPTNISQLVNDAGYLTEHQDISHLATKEEVNEAIDNIDALPDQTNNAGKFLYTDGETASWEKALINNATRENYIAIGNNALVTEDEYGSGVSIGANANAQNNSVAVGGYAETNVAGGLAIGNNAKANNFDATTVYDENGIAIGANAMSTNAQAIAIGGDSQSNGVKSIAIGPNSTAKGEGAIAIGSNTLSNSSQGANIVIGPNSKVSGYSINSIAIGIGTQAGNYDATALGRSSFAGSQYSTAIGLNAVTDTTYCDYNQEDSTSTVALGMNAYSRSNSTVAIGRNVYADGLYSIVIGQYSNVGNGKGYGIAIGKEVQVVGSEGIAVGHASNSSRHGIALGTRAKANEFGTITMGLNAVSNSTNAVAIGNQSRARGQDSVALGSSAEVADGAGFAVQLGTGTNYDTNTLQFHDYKLLYENGIIPYERFSEYTPSNGQVLTYDENEGALIWGEGGSSYELPIATSTRLGGIKVGSGLSINSSGTLSANVQDKAEWGNIDGDIANQTDLQNKFDDVSQNINNINDTIMEMATKDETLQNQIDNLSAIGQFLAIWDCDTHTARYLTEGYQYQAGNYFIIGSIATDDGVNYMPDGNNYPGFVETSEDVKVSDMFFFDGEHWIYLANHERAMAVDADLDNKSTNPIENKAVAIAIEDLDNKLNENVENINVSIEELQKRPTGVGVPQLASVDVAQIDIEEAEERRLNYTDHMGLYSDIVVTLNLDKQDILDKMYDLYITISRFKVNKNLSYTVSTEDGEEEHNYRNIAKFSVLNDLRQKTDNRLYCWRFVTDSGYPETNPQRYCYFYTKENYTNGDALREANPRIGLWYNSDSPSGIGTCFNAIGWLNHGYYAEMYYQDYYGEDTGIERYEEGDISTFVNLKDSNNFSYNPSDYVTKMQCKKYTKDGQNYFFWAVSWNIEDDETVYAYLENGELIANGIPKHFDMLSEFATDMTSFNTLGYEFVENRSDLNYRMINDFDMLLESLEELTFQGRGVGSNKPIEWKCYWFDYPVMPILLKDCEVRIHKQTGYGNWCKLETLVKEGHTNWLVDDIPLELKLPYNTYYLWMRYLAIQKRCTYGNPENWMEEEGREISNPMWTNQKNSLMEGVSNGVISKVGFGTKNGYRCNSDYSKICEYIEFNLCEAKNIAHKNKTKATPIQKRLWLTKSGKSGLRN